MMQNDTMVYYYHTLAVDTSNQGFQSVFMQASDSPKVGDYEKFLEGQKVFILTRVSSDILSGSQQDYGSQQFFLNP